MEELDPSKLDGNQVIKAFQPSKHPPEDDRKPNAAKDDVQIMKLDDENRITETYQKIGNAEVLKIEENPIAEEIPTAQNIEYQDMATSPARYL